MGGMSEKLIFSNLRTGKRLRENFKLYLTNLHTNLKTHIIIKMCRIKFSFISAKSHPPTPTSAHAKYKKKNRKLRFWHLFETPF